MYEHIHVPESSVTRQHQKAPSVYVILRALVRLRRVYDVYALPFSLSDDARGQVWFLAVDKRLYLDGRIDLPSGSVEPIGTAQCGELVEHAHLHNSSTRSRRLVLN